MKMVLSRENGWAPTMMVTATTLNLMKREYYLVAPASTNKAIPTIIPTLPTQPHSKEDKAPGNATWNKN